MSLTIAGFFYNMILLLHLNIYSLQIVKGITWSGEKGIAQTSLGSLMVIVLVRTVHRNIQHLRVSH